MLLSLLILQIKSQNSNIIFLRYSRPQKSPLEIYPPSQIPLCISRMNSTTFPLKNCPKCKIPAIEFNIKDLETTKLWCHDFITENIYDALTQQLQDKYLLSFNLKTKYITVPIGHIINNNYSYVNTFYDFTLFQDEKGELNLGNVASSHPVNLTKESKLQFKYRIHVNNSLENLNSDHFYDAKPNSSLTEKKHISLLYYSIFWLVILLILLFLVVVEPELTKTYTTITATIPSNNFLIVVFVGAGFGGIAYFISIIIMIFYQCKFESWTTILIIPALSSSLFSGVVTLIICTMCRLKDFASALYFAPLVYPSIVLAVIFSVQWIPVCFGSCLTIPMKLVFIYVITVALVKLPANLIAGIVFAYIIKPPVYHNMRSIQVPKLVSSRVVFMTISNIFMFLIVFPYAHLLMFRTSWIPFELTELELKFIFLFIPLWIMGSIIMGVLSLNVTDSFNWASLSFLSTFGSGVALWIVSFIHATYSYGMTGTLQVSLYMSIVTLVCVGLSLAAGSISVLSAVFYVIARGIPAKSS